MEKLVPSHSGGGLCDLVAREDRGSKQAVLRAASASLKEPFENTNLIFSLLLSLMKSKQVTSQMNFAQQIKPSLCARATSHAHCPRPPLLKTERRMASFALGPTLELNEIIFERVLVGSLTSCNTW